MRKLALIFTIIMLFSSNLHVSAEDYTGGSPGSIPDIVSILFEEKETDRRETSRNYDRFQKEYAPDKMYYGIEVKGSKPNNYYHVDMMRYKYIGDENVNWPGYPYIYRLEDTHRKIRGFRAINLEKNIMIKGSSIAFMFYPLSIPLIQLLPDIKLDGSDLDTVVDVSPVILPTEEVPEPLLSLLLEDHDAIDAYGNTCRAWDYYKEHFNWMGPTGNNDTWTNLLNGVDRYINSSSYNENAGGFYWERTGDESELAQTFGDDRGATILFGKIHGLQPYLDMVAHEYTHTVYMAKKISIGSGSNRDKTSESAIAEGYADVMAMAVDTGDWNMHTSRSLSDPPSIKSKVSHFISHVSEYHEGVTECHDAATILGHAAYLMCETDGEGPGTSNRLSRDTMARLFFDSMDYLPKKDSGEKVTFKAVGQALEEAAHVLMHTRQSDRPDDDDMILDEMDARRIVWALEQVGIYINLDYILEGRPVRLRPILHTIDPDAIPKKTPKPSPTPDPMRDSRRSESFEEYIREVLVPRYGTIPQYTLYQSEDRSDKELGGMIDAYRDDFDADGEEELLVSRFHNEAGRNGADELYLTVEMYERDADSIWLQDDRTLLVPGIAEDMGKYGSTIGAFLYRHNGERRIAFDTFYGVNESSVTVAVFSYDGEDLMYEADTCHEAYGSGDILVRYAESEPGARHTLSGVEWRILLEDADEPWVTLDRYRSEEHDWDLPTPEEEELLAREYREMLDFEGVIVGEDCRIVKEPLPEGATQSEYNAWYNDQYFLDLYSVYGDSEDFQMLWQIRSYQPLGGELQLERADDGELLEPYYLGVDADSEYDGFEDEDEYYEDDEEDLDDFDDGESALIDLLMEAYPGDGELLSFGYADYDNDGRMEAFALLGVYDDEDFDNEAELWYVCPDFAMQCERAGGCYPFDSYVTAQHGTICFRVSEGYFGSGSAERCWAASDEMPYLLSGEYLVEDLNIVHD